MPGVVTRMFDRKHNCIVVVGAQWGDEGKGKLVDVLAEQADCGSNKKRPGESRGVE